MANLTYNSCLRDVNIGSINFGTDTFRLMLVTSAYVPSKSHAKRSSVTNEVVGTGYTAGGSVITPTVTLDNVNDRVDVSFSNVSWLSSTISAAAGVIYKARGGAASADELVAYIDFGSTVSSTAGTFTVTFSSPLRFQN